MQNLIHVDDWIKMYAMVVKKLHSKTFDIGL